ncbi:MAG: retropepsin-like aspartic protease [Ardenticatenia bacterium]|nr:retropepsin-like aspartic protease [Ardenticatenia bacterium]
MILGRLHLIANRLSPAIVVLEHALESAAQATTVPAEIRQAVRCELAWALYRLDRFDEAAPHFLALPPYEAVGHKLAAFGDRRPYQVQGVGPVRLPLLAADPAPFVLLTVGSRDHVFLVDTGTGELTLDVTIMEELRLTNYGVRETTFAAGRHGHVIQSILPRLRLDTLVVEHIPVEVMDIHSRAPQIGGIIGLNFLLHFHTTFDYARRELCLVPRDDSSPVLPQDATRVPCYLFESHILVAPGAVNAHETLIWMASGMAGTAFTCPPSTLEHAHLTLPDEPPRIGVSGAGAHDVISFTVPSLRLGPLRQEHVPALYGLFLTPLEWRYDVRIGGLTGHDFLRHYRWTLDPTTLTAWFEETSHA